MLAQQQFSVRQQWNRSLHFADYIVDRWKKTAALGFGEGSSINYNALVHGDVKVGWATWIGPCTVLDGSGGLQISENCSISAGIQIYTYDTVQWAITGGKIEAERAPVQIGSQCYIGPNFIVSKGVTIGDGCVIGAKSFVNCGIPERHKAWGTSARVLTVVG